MTPSRPSDRCPPFAHQCATNAYIGWLFGLVTGFVACVYAIKAGWLVLPADLAP